MSRSDIVDKGELPLKSFKKGKWYKCITPVCKLIEDVWYKCSEDNYMIIGNQYYCGSRFDLSSESDHNPDDIPAEKLSVGDTAEIICNITSDTTWNTIWKVGDFVTVSDTYTSKSGLVGYVCHPIKSGSNCTQTLTEHQLKKVVAKDVKESKIDNRVTITINRNNSLSKVLTDFLTTKEETNMSIQRKSVKVELFDNDKGLPVECSLVGVWENYVTEDTDGITVQEIISTGEVADLLSQHNAVRIELVDEEILTRTGNSVNLRPIKLKNLTWLVDGRKVN